MAESLGHKAAKGTLWASLDRFGYMGLQFTVNLVMARILTPQDFGAIGVLAIFIIVSQTLVDGGFGSALIQKKSPTQEHYSTIFWWNLILATFLYICLFAASPFIAEFFRMPELNKILRVIGLVLPLNSLWIIQNNRLRKHLAFKKLAIVNLLSYFLGASIGVLLALKGLGVWALVATSVFQSLLAVIIIFSISRWLPSFVFSITYFKELFGFGGYILAASLLQEVCKNFQNIIIGRRFNVTDMGYYSQAQKLESVASTSLSGIIVQVMYPVYSTIQEDNKKLQEVLLMNARVISLLVFPILGILILYAEPIIIGLYGSAWLPSVPLFKILCVSGLFACLQNINFYAVAAKGKSKQLFYWSFYKWGMLILLLFLGMLFGLKGLMWAIVASAINIWIVNAYLAQRYIGLRIIKQISALLPMSSLLIGALTVVEILNKYIDLIWLSGLVYILITLALPLAFRLKSISETHNLFVRLKTRK